MYKVIDVADLLGVSKVTIYKKIKMLKPDILDEIIEDDGITYLTDTAVLMIKNSIKRKTANRRQSEKLMELIELRLEVENLNKNIETLSENIEEVQNEKYQELIVSYKYLKEIVISKKQSLEKLRNSLSQIKKTNLQIDEQVKIFATLLQTIK